MASDFIVGLAAGAVAFGLRFGPAPDGDYKHDYVFVTVVVPFFWVISLIVNRAYEVRRLFVGNDEYELVFRSGLILMAAFAVGAYSLDYRLARGYLIIAVPLATALGALARYVLRQRLHRCWGRGERLHRVLLVGHEPSVAEMARRLRRERYHGLGVVGACLPTLPTRAVLERAAILSLAGARGSLVPKQRSGRQPGIGVSAMAPSLPMVIVPGLPPVAGDFEHVAEAVRRVGADTVIVLSCPEIDGTALRRLAWKLEGDDIDLIVASNLIDVAGDRTTIRPMDGMPLLHIEHAYLKGFRRVVKEVSDRVAATGLLLMAAPLMLSIALAVRFHRGASGPVFFAQERVGKGGLPFRMFKFRSMHVDAEARLAELGEHNETGGTLFKMRQDPRVTPVGRLLRRWSLDELPQLINVLIGDMSLVGPRPPLQREVAQYPDDMRRRLVVKPGLTGLWQVSGRSDLSWEESIRLDLSYVENWTLTRDFAILARTAVAVLKRSGAY